MVYVVSVPAGALVSIDGGTASKTTPFTTDSLTAANHTFKFVFSDYTTTLTQTVSSKKIDTLTFSMLTSFSTTSIYETAATGATQYSGLILKTGMTVGFSDIANKGAMDLFFKKTPDYDLESPALAVDTALLRKTFFKTATGTNLADGVSSPVYDATPGVWSNFLSNIATMDTAHYFWIYDNDHNYTKAKVAEYHARTSTSDPAYVKLKYYYNSKGSKLF